MDEPGLFLLGIELLDTAGQTLYEALQSQLEPLYGEDWFTLSLVKKLDDRELAPRDLSVLLVQIEIRNNNNFRLALRTRFNGGIPHDKLYFEHLTDLRIMRNEWFHRIINPITSDELHDLCKTIIAVFPSDTQIAVKATRIQELLDQEDFSASDLMRTSKYIENYVARIEEFELNQIREREIDEVMIQDLINEQNAFLEEAIAEEQQKEFKRPTHVPKIGDAFTGSLLPQKYTLKLDGNILDRRSGTELKEKLGERAISVGRSLLQIHPTGGRLRLSSDGTVVGYVEENWVVVGHVEFSDWFDF